MTEKGGEERRTGKEEGREETHGGEKQAGRSKQRGERGWDGSAVVCSQAVDGRRDEHARVHVHTQRDAPQSFWSR